MEWISSVYRALKLPPKLMAGIALPAGILCCLPGSFLERLGLSEFVATTRPYLALVFIVFSSILLIELISYIAKNVISRRKQSRLIKILTGELEALDFQEICILREFIIQGQKTIKLPIDQPVVAGLVNRGLLLVVSPYGEWTLGGRTYPCKVPDRIFEHLNYEHLRLPKDPTEEQLERIRSERPGYITSTLEYDRLRHSLW